MIIENGTLIKVTSKDIVDGTINIPAGITAIGDGACRDIRELTHIVIPDSVKSIGNWAFIRCGKLKGVILSGSVNYIGWSAFDACGLVSIDIPDGVVSIDANAFADNTDLDYVKGLNHLSQSIRVML